MEKVYKSRVYRVIFNVLCGAILSIFVFFIAHIWLSQLTSIIIATIIFFSYIWLVICGNFITIIVNDKELIGELLPLVEVGASWEVCAFISHIYLPSSLGSPYPDIFF